jgi:hypothetical protein
MFTGLAFGTAYSKLRRIWPVMVAHAAFCRRRSHHLFRSRGGGRAPRGAVSGSHHDDESRIATMDDLPALNSLIAIRAW